MLAVEDLGESSVMELTHEAETNLAYLFSEDLWHFGWMVEVRMKSDDVE